MNRRTYLRTVSGSIAGVALAGCISQDGDDGNGDDESDAGDGDGTLRVATYDSMVDDEDAAGRWLEEAFDEAHPDAEMTWVIPDDDGLNHYINREQFDEEFDVDMYVGLNVDDLARIDDTLEDGALFQELDRDRLEHGDRVRDVLDLGDPSNRVLPYDTGYISLVYDENDVDPPETFDDLLEDEYEDTLLAQNAQQSDPGQAFMLWTIDAYGEEGYLEYWQDLLDNGVRILDDWGSSYEAYENEERPMVVSYSTDQVFANMEGEDMSRHQIAFPEDQGYANPEAMAIFEGSENTDLAYEFMDFVLSNEAQAEIAVRNVQFPAVEDEYVDLPEDFDEFAHVPPEAVTMAYDDLRGNLNDWTDAWAEQAAGH